MEYNSLAVVSKSVFKFLYHVEETVKVLINDCRMSNFNNSLKHCHNMACVSLFYLYNSGLYPCELENFVQENHIPPALPTKFIPLYI